MDDKGGLPSGACKNKIWDVIECLQLHHVPVIAVQYTQQRPLSPLSPKMTGEVLAKELIAIRPDIPVILCTAYSEGLVKSRVEAMGGAFLIKPFDLYELSKAMRKALNKD